MSEFARVWLRTPRAYCGEGLNCAFWSSPHSYKIARYPWGREARIGAAVVLIGEQRRPAYRKRGNMSTALQLHSETMGDWAVIRQQAEVLVKTGFLPQSIKTPEQAMAIILTGREWGIGAMAALNTINVIQGKPTISPQLMLGLINRSGELEDIKIDRTGVV